MATFPPDCYLIAMGDYLTILFEATQPKCWESVHKYPKINHLSVLNKTENRNISFARAGQEIRFEVKEVQTEEIISPELCVMDRNKRKL